MPWRGTGVATGEVRGNRLLATEAPLPSACLLCAPVLTQPPCPSSSRSCHVMGEHSGEQGATRGPVACICVHAMSWPASPPACKSPEHATLQTSGEWQSERHVEQQLRTPIPSAACL